MPLPDARRALLGLSLLLAALPGAALPGVSEEPASLTLSLSLSASAAASAAPEPPPLSPQQQLLQGRSVLLDYRAFLNSSLGARRLGGEARAGGAARALSVQWLAPFFSGGGYCSEAIAFVVGTQPDAAAAAAVDADGAARAAAAAGAGSSSSSSSSAEPPFLGIEFPLSIVQHGDGMNTPFLFGLEPATYDALQRLAGAEPRDRKRVLSICHSEPGAWAVSRALPARYSTSACPTLGAAYRVGRTMFETDRLPQGWADRLNGMHEVWVPTAFMRDVCLAGGVDADKLLVLPEPVDTDVFRPKTMMPAPPAPAAAAAGARAPAAPPSTHIRPRRCVAADGASPVEPGSSAECPFRFLSVGKWERRKGFDVLLRAYLTAFARSNATGDAAGAGAGAGGPFVELYVLTSAYHSSGDFRLAVDRMVRTEIACGSAANERAPPATRAVCVPAQPAAASSPTQPQQPPQPQSPQSPQSALPPVHLLTAIPQSGLVDVYASVDCVVQASRGEGWGRPHVEAMAMALPLIATAWSGPGEFMREDNSYPLRAGAELLPVPDGAFAGHLMAEPDAAHLRELLLRVLARPDEARARPPRARGHGGALPPARARALPQRALRAHRGPRAAARARGGARARRG